MLFGYLHLYKLIGNSRNFDINQKQPYQNLCCPSTKKKKKKGKTPIRDTWAKTQFKDQLKKK